MQDRKERTYIDYKMTKHHVHTGYEAPIRRPAEKPPLRIISSMLLSLLIISLTLFNVGHAESNKHVQLDRVIVEEGDTLWQIAQAHYTGDGDIREFLYYIKQVNHLTSARIYPGQVILIPLVE